MTHFTRSPIDTTPTPESPSKTGRWRKPPVRSRCSPDRVLECRALIGKSTHSPVASKVVIEGAVFLSQDHHMFDVTQLGAAGYNGLNQVGTTATVQTQRRQLGCCRRSPKFKQFAASETAHRLPIPSRGGPLFRNRKENRRGNPRSLTRRNLPQSRTLVFSQTSLLTQN
jgi:hypothetical protein